MKRSPRMAKRQRKAARTQDADRCGTCGRVFDDAAPTFDAEKAAGLDASEVRRLWPRVTSACRCGSTTIRYASDHHYIAGDW